MLHFMLALRFIPPVLSETVPTVRSFKILCIKVVLSIRRLPKRQKGAETFGKGSRFSGNKRYFDDIQSVKQKQLINKAEVKRIFQLLHKKREYYDSPSNNLVKTCYLISYNGNRKQDIFHSL
jgi:hypothetical protein